MSLSTQQSNSSDVDFQYLLNLLLSPDQDSTAFPLQPTFDITKLYQTPVSSLLSHPPESQNNPFQISLAHVVQLNYHLVGTLRYRGRTIGSTCLISRDLVLCARHTVLGMRIDQIIAEFAYFEDRPKYITSFYQCERAMESCTQLGYAILSVKERAQPVLGYPLLSSQTHQNQHLALLHYPKGKGLRVSIDQSWTCMLDPNLLETLHDTDTFSSGSPFIDQRGHVVALHLGNVPQFHNAILHCHAVTIHSIVTAKPNGMIAQLMDGRMQQDRRYGDQFEAYNWPEVILRPL